MGGEIFDCYHFEQNESRCLVSLAQWFLNCGTRTTRHQWYVQAFKVVRETLLFFDTKKTHFVFTYQVLLINSCIFVYSPY